MFLMIDNYDSFVHNLIMYFKEIGEEVMIMNRDEVSKEQIEVMNPKGIIISPGPKSPKESVNCLEIINGFKGRIPILGICLGHQCIGEVFGADIIKGTRPIHGKVEYIENDGKGVFKDLPNKFKVTRYHSLIVSEKDLPSCLDITAKTLDGVIMGVRHKKYDVEGVQFHPEALLTEFGHDMLRNFIKRCD
ncbi:aminodeoxychorismate/anthranilate synthase component II [uncultured Clostridium sp.]|uniref:anthranilate synthase component II n=1 Tax=uncultured Clostridium sp. TaxID=59620 RepID=UPI0026389CA7|nr:aminodeoxychorismate/anthranilate synthase component II [uncultured Clostridium sp.]